MDNKPPFSDVLESINDRLAVIVRHFEYGKKAAFARKVSISPQAAQEMLSGRRSEPSFKVLVKILRSYPQVKTDWLVLGRGPMLQDIEEVDMVIFKPIYASYEQFLEAFQKTEKYHQLLDERLAVTHPESAKRLRDSQIAANTREAVLMRIYSVGDSDTANASALLSDRLGISEQEASNLILSGKLRGTPIGEGYRVTERAVREFLGEA